MAGPHPLYRALVRLYPSAFRREYGEDLVAHYADLVADRGAQAARTRTALDLAITIPRYHLEHVMTEQHSTTVLSAVIGLFAVGGLASLMTDLYPGVIGIVLLAVAAALTVTQRSTLARALRVPDSGLRHPRLRIAAILAGVFVTSHLVYFATIGDGWSNTSTVLVLIGTIAMFGAVGYLIAGLLTPRTPDHRIASTAG